MDVVSWSFGNEKKYDQDKPLYIDSSNPSRSLSARETRSLVRKLVGGFNDHGLEKGDCVCVASFNDIHYTSIFLGIIGAGGCFSGANPGYTVHELTHHVRMTQARFLLACPKTLDTVVAAAAACGIPPARIFVLNLQNEKIPPGHQSWKTLLSCGERNWVEVEDPDNTTAAYVSTSGTSGLPKAAIIPHSYIVSQGQFQEKNSNVRYKLSNLIAVPPFHVFTIPVQHGLPLRKGVPTYISPRYEPKAFCDTLERFRITDVVVVPPILMSLAKVGDESNLASLKRIYVGGSCATDGMQQQLYAKLTPSARIEQVYGMTEVGWATTWHDRKQESTGSVGRPLPGTALRIVNLDGQIVDNDGETGEIHILPPHPMKGYLHNPSATAEAFSSDGWIKTGDIGYVRDGKWYVIDRTKDLIKVRGWQVSPVEIEACLLEHPAVSDAAVIGHPASDGTGEVPLAFVVRRFSDSVSEDELKSFLSTRLARYKNVEGVRFVDKIPRNPTGKILRRVLRDSRTQLPINTPDEAAASAYSSALKDLERSQQRGSACGSVNGGVRPGGHSRSGSLTDASTIDDGASSVPPTPTEGSFKTSSSVALSNESRKRKTSWISPSTVKRRSARIAVGRVRAAALDDDDGEATS